MNSSGTGVRRRPRIGIPVAGIAAFSVVSAIGTAAGPALLARHPLLAIALSPRLLHLVVAAGSVPFPVFLGVSVLRLVAADPLHYLLGRHGAALLEARSERARWALGRARAVVERAGLAAVAFRPIGSVLVAAGASRLRPLPTALADLVGTTVQVVVIYQGGRTVGLQLGHLSPVTIAALSGAAAIVTALVLARRPAASPPPPRLRRRRLAAVRG